MTNTYIQWQNHKETGKQQHLYESFVFIVMIFKSFANLFLTLVRNKMWLFHRELLFYTMVLLSNSAGKTIMLSLKPNTTFNKVRISTLAQPVMSMGNTKNCFTKVPLLISNVRVKLAENISAYMLQVISMLF